MNQPRKVFIAGHRGLVGRALLKRFEEDKTLEIIVGACGPEAFSRGTEKWFPVVLIKMQNTRWVVQRMSLLTHYGNQKNTKGFVKWY